jgi:anti-anti-sigma factor
VKSVLVIDDEVATLTMFKLFLSAYGYTALVAEDGKTGLEIVAREKPGIVFTDLKMPEMDGFEVLKRIKAMAPETEVIVITGHGDMDLVVQALNLDATDFINKPISRKALDAAIRRARHRLTVGKPDTGTVSVRFENHIGVVTVRGKLSRGNRSQLEEGLASLLEQEGSALVVMFDDNAAVNGAGISELITLLSKARQSGVNTAIAGLSENYRKIFETVGVSRFARLFGTVDQALSSL